MKIEEFQHLLDAEPPVMINFGVGQKLILEKDGFTVEFLWKLRWSKRYPWSEVSVFHLRWRRNHNEIRFNTHRKGPLVVLARLFNGYDSYITTGFKSRYSFEQLTDLMNHWRERALAAK